MKIPNFSVPKTREQLANQIGITRMTLYRKCKNLGIECPSGVLFVETQRQILLKLGYSETDISDLLR